MSWKEDEKLEVDVEGQYVQLIEDRGIVIDVLVWVVVVLVEVVIGDVLVVLVSLVVVEGE